ncbi:PH domain-containing protein [Tuberibacillus sp. Marseille-P3662]|uniref:PH domain-containing protein n=1 Tax=Tuberibacillus sp. Marseille-P3662 TaxID=1965358 RepID=UPI000A1CCE5D|nr:PH domain-containing protein [Tuberibacillus sp. Marseille-P3662]
MKKIDPRAILVWRWSQATVAAIFWLVTIAILVATFYFEWPTWIDLILFGCSLVYTGAFVIIWPRLRWRRWSYSVNDEAILIKHGVIIIQQTIVPMIRIQHVDHAQGPYLRRYHLATIKIHTAATTHEIPALPETEAYQLRDHIAALIKVSDEDV